MTTLEAALFDFDGLVVDSEPLWQAAERYVFGSVGVVVTERLQLQTQGMTTQAVTEFWFRRQPWVGPSLEEVEGKVVARVADALCSSGAVLPGVIQAFSVCEELGLRIGLVTNSPRQICLPALKALNIEERLDVVVTADDVQNGKPAPDSYLMAAGRLEVGADRCIALEDSPTGAIAARSAGMPVVGVPSHPSQITAMKDHVDFVLSSLNELNESLLQRF